MKHLRYVIPLLPLLFIGCGASQETSQAPPPAPTRQYRLYEMDFVPSEHDPLPHSSSNSVDTSGTATPVAGTRGDTAVAASMDLVQGFRVQVFSSLSIDLASAKKLELEMLFPEEWFYLEYDPPAYKIRSGNFTAKFDADRYARALAEKGFPDSWSVPTHVYKFPPRRALPAPDH